MGCCCWRDRAGLSVQRDRSLGAHSFVLSPSAVSQLVSAINGDFANLPLLGAAKRSGGKTGKDTEADSKKVQLHFDLFDKLHAFSAATGKTSFSSSVKRNNWCVYVQTSQWWSVRRGPGCHRLLQSSPAGGDCCYPYLVVHTRFLPSE